MSKSKFDSHNVCEMINTYYFSAIFCTSAQRDYYWMSVF